ncbi:MAG: SMP-30/gluconolactonase/LRE family protein [Candidatus Atribacteria bacterium]|nr:SMP-30/gluconolactonase/LRE family protein [Candidatus Atribacteria bacterium]
MVEPVIVTDVRCRIGENPSWHTREKKLYWLDIPIGTIYRYDPASSMVEKVVESNEVIGGFTLQEDDSLLLFMERGAIKIWRNNSFLSIMEEIPILNKTRFNDVIVDPMGRVFCGTMPDENGVAYLFLLETNGDIKLILDNVGLSNGMGFTPDKKKIYFTDSKKGEIRLFDYNKKNGSLSKERIFLKIKEPNIEPDGLTVDSEGYIWSAQWNGACIKRYTPQGEEVMKIDLPTKKITSLTFAGESFQEVYVTSAIGEENIPGTEDEAGALFYFKSDIAGIPENRSKVLI